MSHASSRAFSYVPLHLAAEGGNATVVAGTFVLRLGEAVIAAVPDLLVGLLIAVLLRHLIGDERLRAALGRWWVTAIACVALPVGPAGVLPVAVVLRRAGVRLASVATVLVVGGAVGPLSFAYLLERATPGLSAILLAMLIAASGLLFLAVAKLGSGKRDETSNRNDDVIGDDTPGLLPALGEVRALAFATAIPLASGLVIFAAIASVLGASFFGGAMHEAAANHAAAAAGLLPILFYMPATAALFSGEAAAGVYPGAAWTALLGGGLSVATIFIAFKLLGRRAAVATLAAAACLLLAGFVLLQFTPRQVPLAPEDSHAFDGLSQPFNLTANRESIPASWVRQWSRRVTPTTYIAAGLILVLCVLPARSRGDRPVQHLSGRVLRLVGAFGVVAWAIGTLYVYFPAPAVVLKQMRHAEGELSAGVIEDDRPMSRDALRKIDALAQRGMVGARLRMNSDAANGMRTVQDETLELLRQTDAPELFDFADANVLFETISDQRRLDSLD
ncbi:MAG: hypothetical protein AAGK78_00715 [Planctomycetota bacterium]